VVAVSLKARSTRGTVTALSNVTATPGPSTTVHASYSPKTSMFPLMNTTRPVPVAVVREPSLRVLTFDPNRSVAASATSIEPVASMPISTVSVPVSTSSSPAWVIG
jgi:hypothetical protein